MKIHFIGLITVFALLAGCGNSNNLEGLYAYDGLGDLKFEFKGGGEGYASVNGQKTVIEYKVDGENLIITGNGQTNVLTIEGDILKGGNFAIGNCSSI